MKLIKLLLLMLVVNNSLTFSQRFNCGTDHSNEEVIKHAGQIQQILKFRANSKVAMRAPSEPYIIPVVFHMFTYGINNNLNATPLTKEIMTCRINEALNIANGDFNGTSTPNSVIDPRFQSIRGTLPIKFVAATIDPDGNKLEIPGLDWRPEVDINYGYEGRLTENLWFGRNGKYYMDIAIVNFPNEDNNAPNQSAYAMRPSTNEFPRIVFNHRYVSSICGASETASFSKVISHEIGHYFGLLHTFNEDCNSSGDGISDTPPTKGSDGCTRNVLNSCGVYPNLENLMDYNNECQSMFTKEQTTAMDFWLTENSTTYPRRLLWQISNLSATGINSSRPIARFTTKGSSICTGKSVQFIDESVGLQTTRSWTFTGGSPATSTAVNPTVTYNTPGQYTVSLTVSNANGSNSITKTSLIRVNTPLTSDISETFSGNFPPEGWSIQNDDNNVTFVKGAEGGNGDLTSLLIDNYFYKSSGKIDYITLPNINLASGASGSQLTFDLSYVKENETSVDALAIEVSTDCGASWTSVYNKSKDQLQTFSGTTLGANRQFRPTKSEHWRKETISLSSFVGQSNVMIRFKNTTDFGHRTWIDNVTVTRGSGGVIITPPPVGSYCEGTAEPRYFNIINVKLANLNYSSSGFPTKGYSNFTSQTANVVTGRTETVSVTSNYNNATVPNHYNVWIDWNQNGSFNDAGEKVLNTRGIVTGTASFVVPSTAKTGNTRMRVRYSFNKDFDACGFDDYFGEVEDYTVSVSSGISTPTPTLAVPTGIRADVYANGFFAVWTKPAGVPTVEVQILRSGSWVTVGTSNSHYLFVPKEGSNLNYTFRVRSVNGSSTSVWSASVNTTLLLAKLSKEDSSTENFKAHPIPAKEIIYFMVPTVNNTDTTIEIFDISGRQVGKLINTYEFNVTNLSKGIYVAKLSSTEINESKTFIVE